MKESAGDESLKDPADQGASNEKTTAKPSWMWKGQPIGPDTIDEDKKAEALAACHPQHEELVKCLKGGFFANCTPKHKAFWDCYALHRGIRGNKVMAWLAPPPMRHREEGAHEKPG